MKMTDLDFAVKVSDLCERKAGLRARRLLALYMAGRKPSTKQLEEYEVMAAVMENARRDVEKIWSFECEVASFNED
jgi:uncharacterized protein YifE (UPF0438 family)